MSGQRWTTILILSMAAVLTIQPLTADERDDRIEKLEREIAELRELLTAAREAGDPSNEERLREVERKIDILAAEVEALRIGKAAVTADESVYGMGPAASKIYRTERGVSIGGYGEFLYENYSAERQDGAASGRSDQLDALRAIIYVGYKFDDRFLFNQGIKLVKDGLSF